LNPRPDPVFAFGGPRRIEQRAAHRFIIEHLQGSRGQRGCGHKIDLIEINKNLSFSFNLNEMIKILRFYSAMRKLIFCSTVFNKTGQGH